MEDGSSGQVVEAPTPECPYLVKMPDREEYHCKAVHWGIRSDGSPVAYVLPLSCVKHCLDIDGHRGCPDYKRAAVQESHYSSSFVKMCARVLTFSLAPINVRRAQPCR